MDPRKSKTFVSWPRVAIATVILAFSLVAGLMWFRAGVSSGDIVYLSDERGAQWIRYDRPLEMAFLDAKGQKGFRIRLEVEEVPAKAEVYFRALRRVEIFLDRELIFSGAQQDIDSWSSPGLIDIAPRLTPGTHELLFAVSNENGAVGLVAACRELGLYTGPDWESTHDDVAWTPALPMATRRPAYLSRAFQSSTQALVAHASFYVALILIVSVGFWVISGREESVSLNASHARWFLMAAWCVLAVNNGIKLPLYLGYDTGDHLKYIKFILENSRLPLATDGGVGGSQLFQAPLFYLLSAGPFTLVSHLSSTDNAAHLLRAIPLLCGMLQIELCYRATRHVFPERSDLQFLGAAFGVMIPMNVYMSQYVSNEPVLAVLTGSAFVIALRHMLHPQESSSVKAGLQLGTLWGLALITKVSALMLGPALLAVPVYMAHRRRSESRSPMRDIAQSVAAFGVSSALISGWFFMRNWLTIGKAFGFGWDPARGVSWRQDPGYRTAESFNGFGDALLHPFHAGYMGLWDSLYSTFWADGFMSGGTFPNLIPQWNYSFMAAGALLALAPCAVIVFGAARAFVGHNEAVGRGTALALLCIFPYFAGLLYLYISLPVFSTGKVTYTLSLIPCYAVLCAAGFDWLARNRFVASMAWGMFACWWANVYVSFFVL